MNPSMQVLFARSPVDAGNHCRSAFAVLLSAVSRPETEESQQLGPDPFLPRGRDARGRFDTGNSGNPRGRGAALPTPGGACPISSPGPERAGAVGSHRPQAHLL